VSVHNEEFESGLFKKIVREGIEDSDGRDTQNMWKRLDVFYSMLFIGVFISACFELYNEYTGLFELLFIEYHVGALNP